MWPLRRYIYSKCDKLLRIQFRSEVSSDVFRYGGVGEAGEVNFWQA